MQQLSVLSKPSSFPLYLASPGVPSSFLQFRCFAGDLSFHASWGQIRLPHSVTKDCVTTQNSVQDDNPTLKILKNAISNTKIASGSFVTKCPLHWSFVSQSPSPWSHGFALVQQPWSFPLHLLSANPRCKRYPEHESCHAFENLRFLQFYNSYWKNSI